jgi:trehalose 6-phosphate synthase
VAIWSIGTKTSSPSVLHSGGGDVSSAHLVLASDRGPVTYALVGGRLRSQRRSGSVTSVLASATAGLEGTGSWVATSTSPHDADALAAGLLARPPQCGTFEFEPLVFDEGDYARYYHDVATRMLWFAHHDLWGELPPIRFGADDLAAFVGPYQQVNQAVAGRITTLSHPGSLVSLHDYQLATTPTFLRQTRPDQPIAYFQHTAFGPPAAIFRLPEPVVVAVLEGMLAADLVGFQASRWAEHFLACCELLGAAVDRSTGTVDRHGHRTWVRCYPLHADAAVVRSRAFGRAAERWARRLDRETGDRLQIVRVDRLDPAKNALRGFQALERLLERRPDLHRRLHVVACLVPSRESMVEYRWYARRVQAQLDRLQTRFRGVVSIHLGHDLDRALGVMRGYDVLLVNPLCDGMNLVAQEGPLVNQRAGTVVLSTGAGCADLYGDHAVTIADPTDLEATTDALELALELPRDERQARAAAMRTIVESETVPRWMARQLTDLRLAFDGTEPTTPVAPAVPAAPSRRSPRDRPAAVV